MRQRVVTEIEKNVIIKTYGFISIFKEMIENVSTWRKSG